MLHTSLGETYILPEEPEARRNCYAMIQRIARSKLEIRDIEQEHGTTGMDKQRKYDWGKAVGIIVRCRIALRQYGALP